MLRIDTYPTHQFGNYRLRPGKPFPFGATFVPGGVNFAVFSCEATACTLVLFRKGEMTPLVEIPFPDAFRIGNVWAMIVFDLDYENIEYGYRMDGPYEPAQGHRFDSRAILLDPYAKAVGGRDVWGQRAAPEDPFPYRGRLIFDDFDWEGDRPLEIPTEDLVIYEMHVRGFTKHPSSGVKQPGTFAAIREKIPHLKALGVNCVELLPVYEFDELEYARANPVTGEPLYQYWGYNTVGFFAPKAGYAATGKFGMQADEFKALVKALHQHGIEVLLDVVFNHTAEGDEKGPTFSFRGLDNKTYYMLTPDGHYYNFSGTGNTLNCNHPVVRSIVLDCLRYWAAEYHIDGFRFDLASILGRDQFGAPINNPPLLESLAHDPILAHCKLIAEAWDAGGLYQVGSFPNYGRWAEWNGKFRDALRRFLKGDPHLIGEMAMRLSGSPDLYASRGATASINFVTAHDGFTLRDLVSYNDKHNLANGEDNRDGANDNYSWNCGVEGETDDPAVRRLRRQQIRNAAILLLASQGVPMILMGDEMGRTQGGNNNAYCHDSALNWLDWTLAEQNADILRFFQRCIAFRAAHPVLRNRWHLSHRDYVGSGDPDISWHGREAYAPDWESPHNILAFMLDGAHARGGTLHDDTVYVALNMFWEPVRFELPRLPAGQRWYRFADTGALPPDDVAEVGREKRLSDQTGCDVAARAAIILVGRP